MFNVMPASTKQLWCCNVPFQMQYGNGPVAGFPMTASLPLQDSRPGLPSNSNWEERHPACNAERKMSGYCFLDQIEQSFRDQMGLELSAPHTSQLFLQSANNGHEIGIPRPCDEGPVYAQDAVANLLSVRRSLMQPTVASYSQVTQMPPLMPMQFGRSQMDFRDVNQLQFCNELPQAFQQGYQQGYPDRQFQEFFRSNDRQEFRRQGPQAPRGNGQAHSGKATTRRT